MAVALACAMFCVVCGLRRLECGEWRSGVCAHDLCLSTVIVKPVCVCHRKAVVLAYIFTPLQSHHTNTTTQATGACPMSPAPATREES